MTSRREFVKQVAGVPIGAAVGGLAAGAPYATAGEHGDSLPADVWIDIRDFGAVGDGRVDDAPAIQSAIDSLNSRRGIIIFPPGSYRCEGWINAKRGHLMGSGVPGAAGGGGTTLRFPDKYGIRSTIQDNFGYEISFLRVVGSGARSENGQVLVDFTGQNYPRMRECRVSNADIGIRIANGDRIECHYGAFFNVQVDQCRYGIDFPGFAHSHKFFAGRIWNCICGVRNVGANDIAFMGTEFESDRPLWHPPSRSSAYPVTLLVGTRQESDRAPLIEAGSFSDLGSYWSGYRRPAAFAVRDGGISLRGQVLTAGVASDEQPVKQNLLRNPSLLPDPNDEAIPGWESSGGTMRFLIGPFGRIVKVSDPPQLHHFLQQEHIKLPAGAYTVGYGFETEGTAEVRLYVFDGDRPLLQALGIPGDYAGGIVRRSFRLESDSERIRIQLYRAGTIGTTLYYYAPYLVPAGGSGAFSKMPEEGRPHEVRYGASAPRAGTWHVGDIVYNTEPTPGGYVGWVCVTAGAPGSWKGFGKIST